MACLMIAAERLSEPQRYNGACPATVYLVRSWIEHHSKRCRERFGVIER